MLHRPTRICRVLHRPTLIWRVLHRPTQIGQVLHRPMNMQGVAQTHMNMQGLTQTYDPHRRDGWADAWCSLARQSGLIKPMRACLKNQPLQLFTKKLIHFQTQTILVKISGQKTKKRHKCSIRKGEDDGGRERKESESKSKRKICEQNC